MDIVPDYLEHDEKKEEEAPENNPDPRQNIQKKVSCHDQDDNTSFIFGNPRGLHKNLFNLFIILSLT